MGYWLVTNEKGTVSSTHNTQSAMYKALCDMLDLTGAATVQFIKEAK